MIWLSLRIGMQADKLLQLERIKIVMLLDELFEGRIYPSENVFPKTDEFKFVMHESDKLIKYFQERMSKDDSKKMEELHSLLMVSQNMLCKEQFKYGFAMGVLLMKEVYDLSGELTGKTQ